MKLIIAGSRTLFPTVSLIDSIINYHEIPISEIVSGCAKGVDICGEEYAFQYQEMGLRYHNPSITRLTIKKFPADWNTHGKAAGHIRNKQMAEYAEAFLS